MQKCKHDYNRAARLSRCHDAVFLARVRFTLLQTRKGRLVKCLEAALVDLVFSSCNLVVCCSNATISRTRSERESGNLLSSHCQGKRASGETHRIQILFTTLFKTSTVRPGVRRPAGRGGVVLSAHLAVITPSVSSGAQWCRTPHTYSKYLTSNSRVFAHDVAGGIPLRCRCLRQIYYVRTYLRWY